MHQKVQHEPTILRRRHVEQRTGLSRSTLHPQADIVVCADDDHGTTGNPGRTLARQAALAAGARLAIPDFGLDRPADASDFNDQHRIRGLSSVLTVDGVFAPVLSALLTAGSGVVEPGGFPPLRESRVRGADHTAVDRRFRLSWSVAGFARAWKAPSRING